MKHTTKQYTVTEVSVATGISVKDIENYKEKNGILLNGTLELKDVLDLCSRWNEWPKDYEVEKARELRNILINVYAIPSPKSYLHDMYDKGSIKR